MNNHVSNFLEALVFADEVGMDTSALRRDAKKIVAAFIAAHGAQVEAYDADDLGEGSAAFVLGLAMTGSPSDEPSWLLLAALTAEYTQWLTAAGFAGEGFAGEGCALELLIAGSFADGEGRALTAEERAWLSDFIARWDDAEEA